MRDYTQFYINGKWVSPTESRTLPVENPATLDQCATISIGSEADVDPAVAAAREKRSPLSADLSLVALP